MCVQCMGVATAAVGSASGIRAYLAARRPAGLGRRGLRLLTVVLMAVAVLASGIAIA